MRLKIIACEVFCRELYAAAACSVNQVDLTFLPKGLHDQGAETMRLKIQELIDQCGKQWEAVALGYGLCGNGLAGLTARSIPLVVARAHDCITFFMGSRRRYLDYFRTHPGVYFMTTGWVERSEPDDRQLSLNYNELLRHYGEEQARYLERELTRHYRQFTFIEMGVEPDDRFEQQVRRQAAERGWDFEKIQGDMGLIRRLVNGPWEEPDFLVAPPGSRIVPTYDENIIGLAPASDKP